MGPLSVGRRSGQRAVDERLADPAFTESSLFAYSLATESHHIG
jgi:hypothetical protein